MIPPAPVAQPAPAVRSWQARGRALALDRPRILGVLNVTPDSFSDGGRWTDRDRAMAHVERMLAEGADIIDVGGESTRPQGATAVAADEESRRVLPVIAELARRFPDALISVDTVKSAVASRALEEGAHIINDVSAFRLDPRMPEVCAEHEAGVMLMHSRGTVSTMGTYADAHYAEDPMADVIAELERALDTARRAGVPRDAIVLDPGIGFAKRSEHSLHVLSELPRLVALGHPVAVGVSRKRFIGEITGVSEPSQRVHGTVGANVFALTRGAMLFRVHDVRPNREALDVAWTAWRMTQIDNA